MTTAYTSSALAEMTDAQSGALHRYVGSTSWPAHAPVWTLGDGWLSWSEDEDLLTDEELDAATDDSWLAYFEGRTDRPPTIKRWVAPADTLLEDFVALSDASDDGIARYARRFGVLELCSAHGEPITHARSPGVRPCSYIESRSRPGIYRERTSDWRRLAGDAAALLEVASALHRNQTPLDEAIKVLTPEGFPAPASDPLRTEVHRFHVVSAVDRWLSHGPVGFALTWGDRDPELRLSPGGLAGGLAIQLMLAVARSDGILSCSACARPFFSRRAPRRGQGAYCATCGRAAQTRAASKRYRERQRQTR